MGGRMSRDKGKRGERAACKALADVWPGLERIYGQARMDSTSPDIDAPGCPVFIEVKCEEQRSVYEAMRQALEVQDMLTVRALAGTNSARPRPPVVVHKRNRGPWLVTVRACDLARLMGR